MHEPDGERGVRPLPYLPGVDGLRAVAVVAVVLYHADVSWLPAGFLGVDVFFAISGYLIASLLLGEHRHNGAIDVVRFWRRRARRLLPALLLVLAAVSVAAVTVARDAADRLTGDLPAALFYVSNWWQVLRDESYFETIGRPPLLRHLWSLGVEEQFYVVAPLALALLLRRRVRRAHLAVSALGLAVVSTVLLAVLWSPADSARAYYGTDTRAAPLLLGVALAAVWPAGRLVPAIAPGARVLLDLTGVGALAGLAAFAVLADEFGTGLYRGGFLAVAALSVLAVAVAAHPASRFGAALARRPLVWLGTRSYAIYLWHWPVIVLTRPGLDVDVHGNALLALRVAVTLVLAEASWRWVEQPFRTGRAQRAYRLRPAVERRRIASAVLAVSLVAWLAVVVVEAPGTDVSLVSAPSSETTLATWPSTTAPTTTTAAPTTAPSSTAPPATEPPVTAPPAPPGPVVPAGPVLAVGDSVLLAARPAVERASAGMVQVDAEVGRQVWDVLELLERYRAIGAFSQLSALVVHLGTNGPLSGRDFERLAAAVEGVPRVLVLTVRVPRRWEETSNASIREGVPRHPAMRLVDWYGASGQPGMLGDDGVHPTRDGMEVYARIVLEQLDGLTPPPPPPPPPDTTTTAPPPPPPDTTTTAPPPPPPPPPETTTTPPPPPPSTTTTLLPV